LEQNTLKIVDFGLSSFCNVPEYMFKRCGTPGYVAPEIINSSSKDNTKFCPKVDVFSAGVIFYILFIGKSPFKGKSFQEILD
jgi:serine/threonine protein kinase